MIWFLLLALLLIVIDQVVKAVVVLTLVDVGTSIPVIPGFFHITYTRNEAAMMGIGNEQGIPVYFFIAVGVLALAVFAFMIARNDYRDRRRFWYSLALSLLVAGALGNLIDRIFQVDHSVIDYLDFRGIWVYIFNFADMCLSVGIGIYVFDQFFLDPKRTREDAKKKAEAEPAAPPQS